jgi:tyrosyl-tRNA synthetase
MKTKTDKKKIKEALSRAVENIYPSFDALAEKLYSGKRLRLYCGYDPSSPTLHIGHMITLKKMAHFQELGHEVIMLIGDFTGMIGDPTDKTAVRKKLTRQEVIENCQQYKKQASKFINFSGSNPAKLKYNSHWSDKLSFVEIIELASNFTVQQMIIRDMFQERIKNKKPVFLHEFLYPLAQAYDSLAMDVDLEIGGNDQTFNMLCGRHLMKALKNKEKFVLTTKLLTDSSGKKMGKTEGNMVNLNEKAEEMYGKIMSWPDEVISLALELCTDIDSEEIEKISLMTKKGKINPRDTKAMLAQKIVSLCHNEKKAQQASQEFEKIFRRRECPSDIPLIKIKEKKLEMVELIMMSNLSSSRSEARRLISQKAVKVGGKIIDDWKKEIEIKKDLIVQVGKRKFVKII